MEQLRPGPPFTTSVYASGQQEAGCAAWLVLAGLCPVPVEAKQTWLWSALSVTLWLASHLLRDPKAASRWIQILLWPELTTCHITPS